MIDIQDTFGQWLSASVVQVRANECLMHYSNWSKYFPPRSSFLHVLMSSCWCFVLAGDSWDEWMDPRHHPHRFADAGRFTQGDASTRYALQQQVLVFPPASRWFESGSAKWHNGTVVKVTAITISFALAFATL
jgi:hypothetical protein